MSVVTPYLMHGVRLFPDVAPRQRSCRPVAERISHSLTAAEPEGNNFKGFYNFILVNEKARKDQILVLDLRWAATSLDRG